MPRFEEPRSANKVARPNIPVILPGKHRPGPWAVVRAAGAMVSMAGGIQISCLAMKKAAMNAAIILKLGVF